MNDKPTVYVVDDDAAVRESLHWLVSSVGLAVETFDNGQAFLDGFDPQKPGCIVIDVRMPGMDGLELQRELLARKVHIPVIIITGHGAVALAVRALKNGAVDFIEKPFSDQTLLDTIHKALRIDDEARKSRATRAIAMARVAKLTPREREVMQAVVAGLANKQVAAQLGVSPKTIEAHRAGVMRKTGAGSLAELVRIAQVAEGGVLSCDAAS